MYDATVDSMYYQATITGLGNYLSNGNMYLAYPGQPTQCGLVNNLVVVNFYSTIWHQFSNYNNGIIFAKKSIFVAYL
jgi:hypothetical protein